MKRFCSIFIMGMVVFALAGCGLDKETREYQLTLRQEGIALALEEDYEGAISCYDKALGLAGMHAGALERDIAAYKAAALHRSGKTAEAIDVLSAVLDLKKSAEIYLTRGLLYREIENNQAAKADFAAALKMTPSKDQVMLGRLSYYMEDYENAKKYLEAAQKAGDHESLYWQAELYHDMGNEGYAISLYQSYLDGEPEQVSAYEHVASYLIEQEKYDEALEILEKGIARGESKSLKGLLANEIAVYEYKGDFETAKLKMEAYLESYPDDKDALREYEFLKSR